jgi:hypothetical protein
MLLKHFSGHLNEQVILIIVNGLNMHMPFTIYLQEELVSEEQGYEG